MTENWKQWLGPVLDHAVRILENLWRREPSLWDFGGADQKLSGEV